MSWTDGNNKTFKAGEALVAGARVKLEAGSTTNPYEVVYADAGESAIGVTLFAVNDGDLVSLKLINSNGTYQMRAGAAIAALALVYGADDGEVKTTATGPAFGYANEAATADAQLIEVIQFPVLQTTAATVSIADAGAFTAAATVEAATQEIYQSLISVQGFVPIPLTAFTLEDGTPLTKFVDGASATPGFAQLADKELVIEWNNHATPTAIITNIPMPTDLDSTGDVVIHVLAAMDGATDTPEITTEAYFGAGDTDAAGTDDEIDGGTTVTEYINTIDASDVPALPTQLTFLFAPASGEIGTDDCLIYGVWLEYTSKLKTS